MKQFAVIGCGRFGSSVAKTLFELGHEVLVIDKDEMVIQEISDSVTHAIQIDVTDEVSLKALGLRNFDVVVVSIGADIQSSIFATLMVKDMGVKYVIAKALNELQAKVLYKIGADRVVFPERDMGVRVAYNLVSPCVLDNIPIAPDFNILEVAAMKEWHGKTLRELKLKDRYGITVIAIKQGEEIKSSPSPFEEIRKGDIMVVMGHKDTLKKLEEME